MFEIEPVVKDLPRVGEFYSGRSIFLTGFSGFLGKIVVEKLLWFCPDIKAIYVLLREKKGQTCDERIKKVLNSDCFDRVRKHKEESFKKVIGIQGDVQLPGLGISEEDRCKIISDVSIVIHSAASVKFDDPLTLAMDLNFKGTKSMLDLATQMQKLEVFVYVSTAYSNCDRFNIEEKMYEPHANWSDMMKIRDNIDETVFNILSAKCYDSMPNTYVFTKSLAEHMAYEYGKKIPVVIYRPSIVTNAISEPTRGWIGNLNGPTGILIGYGTGVIRTSLQKKDNRLDFIPCDAVVRYLLWIILIKPYQRKGMTPVYNAATKDRSPTSNDLGRIGVNICKKYPMKYLLWKPNSHLSANYALFYFNFMVFQLLPAVVIDLFLKLLGKKTGLLKLQRKIFIAMSALTYFTMNQFHFENEKAYILQNYVHPDDLKEIEYLYNDNEKFIIEDYLLHSYNYMSKKFLKQTPEDYSKAKRIYNLILIADSLVKIGFISFCGWLFYKYEVVQTLAIGIFDFITNF